MIGGMYVSVCVLVCFAREVGVRFVLRFLHCISSYLCIEL